MKHAYCQLFYLVSEDTERPYIFSNKL